MDPVSAEGPKVPQASEVGDTDAGAQLGRELLLHSGHNTHARKNPKASKPSTLNPKP